MRVAGRRFTVVGAGRSGLAAAHALASRGADVRLVEARPGTARPESLHPDAAFEAGTNAVREGDVAVLSPGIPEVSPVRGEIAAVADEVIGEVELFWRLSPAPVVAVTGTDGKSTTTTMIGAVFEASGRPTFVGGNLGNPLCEGLEEITSEHVVVAEISAFQLTTCDGFRPRVAVVTNIAEDHLDYHGGFAPYQAAKRRIWRRMGEGDTVVLNADDPHIARWPLPEGPTLRRFSLESEADGDLRDDTLTLDGTPLMERSELRLLGSHNVANALAAALAADALGVDRETIRRALAAYEPLPHRLQPVGTVDGVLWVNDSKATNPNAAAAGIRAVEGDLIVLCGGSSKDADFLPLGGLIRERARAAICFGQTRDEIAAAVGPEIDVRVVETLEDAVARARDLARPGDTVLLSPGCASFDQFRSYAHRGEVFTALLRSVGG
ncbi:MAG: UDP-N-acetylmuramoyl-L-alanine--D-glutamate ligase [Myxococcota bacterium]